MKLFALPTIFVDFESFWASDYTLSKMPTQAYIQDARFKAHGACFAVNDGPIIWVTHEKLPAFLKALDRKYPQAIWVAHNALFDLTILSLVYGVDPLFIADTAGMSRALVGPQLRKHALTDVGKLLTGLEKGRELEKTLGIRDLSPALEESIAGYCTQDVQIMREVYRVLAPLFPAKELEVMTWLTRMMTDPKILLDEQLLWNYHHEVVGRKEKILIELGIDKKDLMSNDKFATLLLALGVTPPTKTRPPTEIERSKGRIEEVTKYAFAKTDTGLKDLLEHDNEDVQALVAARLEVKSTIEETRSRTFAELAQCNPIGVPLAYSGAVNTHRFSGRDKLNFQNLKRGGKLRDSITAAKGYDFIVSDLSQIELRFTLWLAGHSQEVQFLAEGGDLYSEVATELYGVEVTKAKASEDKIIAGMRHVGKSTVLGSGFGMGAAKYQAWLASQSISVTSDFAQAAIKLFRSKFNGVPKLWRKMELYFLKLLQDQTPFTVSLNRVEILFGFEPLFGAPGIQLPNGLWLKYPNLKIEDQQWTYTNGGVETNIFGGHFLENLCQALARIVMTERTVKVNRQLPVILSVHDELVALAPEEDAPEWSAWVHEQMTSNSDWLAGMPVGAETKYGNPYGAIK